MMDLKGIEIAVLLLIVAIILVYFGLKLLDKMFEIKEKKHKRHFGKMPDFLAWIFCNRTVCTKRRNQILHRKEKKADE